MSIKSALNQSSLFRFTAKDIFITGDEWSTLLKIIYFHCPIYQLSLIRQHCVATKVLFLAPSHKTTKIHDFLSLLCAQWHCSLPTWVGLPGWHTFFPITTSSSRICIGIFACAKTTFPLCSVVAHMIWPQLGKSVDQKPNGLSQFWPQAGVCPTQTNLFLRNGKTGWITRLMP